MKSNQLSEIFSFAMTTKFTKSLLIICMIFTSVCAFAINQTENNITSDSIISPTQINLKIDKKSVKDECTKILKNSDYKAICGDIAARNRIQGPDAKYYEFHYEKRIWDLSCADPHVDTEEVSKQKIGIMWNKYKKDFKCDSLEFNVQNGNLLKFSISQSMPEVIETLAITLGLDINFVDPADNKNVLDYVNFEITRLSKLQNSAAVIKIYNEYRDEIIGLGAKPSKP